VNQAPRVSLSAVWMRTLCVLNAAAEKRNQDQLEIFHG
jgi:hypothetical protein